MDGSFDQYSMDGESGDFGSEDDSSEPILSNTDFDIIKTAILTEISAQIDLKVSNAVKDAFVDLMYMLSLRKFVDDQRRESGWVDNYMISHQAESVRTDINDFFANTDLMKSHNIEGLADQLGKVMVHAGLLDVSVFESRMDELNTKFKIVTDMLADPHLALSERVKSFELK